MNVPKFSILLATTNDEFLIAKSLFEEYAESIQVDLCFQNFEKELQTLNEQYVAPTGALFLLNDTLQHEIIGCVGVRKYDGNIAELKRMYVKPGYRGLHLGNMLLTHSIESAKKIGYTSLRLDTLPTMTTAISLYKKFGFEEIVSYRYNPIDGTKYYELNLQKI